MSSCGNPCAKCGQQSCVCCDPSVLNQPRIFNPTISGGVFTGGTFNASTINAPTLNGGAINGATLDCATQACTQPPGTCDASPATTGFVCDALSTLVSSGNPAFCAEVINCVNLGGITCAIVDTCLSTVPGIISTSAAFGPGAQATTLLAGVLEIATLTEIENANCALITDPCTLAAFWAAPNTLSPMWAAFQNAVTIALATPAFCTAVFACGAAPLVSPAFIGIPTSTTAGGGDNTTQIATTAFVQGELTALLVPSAAFCAAVDVCIPTSASLCAAVDACITTSATLCGAVSACGFAPLISPLFTGDPRATTPAFGDSDTSIATTAFVQTAVDAAYRSIFFSGTTTGNVAATETDAFSHAIAGGTLGVNGDTIEFEAAGTFAATGSLDKRVRALFGAAVVFDSGLLAITTAEFWTLKGTIMRTAAALQKLQATFATSDGTFQASANYATGAEVLAGAVILKLTVNGTLANDTVAEMYKDKFVAAP